MKRHNITFVLACLLCSFVAAGCHGQTGTGSSVERKYEIKQEQDGLTIMVNDKLFARYVINQANKPFLWPIIGPTGKPMTRAFPMKMVESESKQHRDHPHHRGLLFGHESAGFEGWHRPRSKKDWEEILAKERTQIGGDTWHEASTYQPLLATSQRKIDGQRQLATLASIKHREFKSLEVDNIRALVIETCDHVDRDGKRFLTEERRLVFQANLDTRSIDFDQKLTATDGDVILADRKDAGIGIRVPVSMAMNSKQGGKVINSKGQSVKEAWGKPAKWCDYHGPVDGEHLGIAFLSHPTSYRYPSRWHVREYGLFTANPFGVRVFEKELGDGATNLKRGESLMLKHRLIFHKGDAEAAKIEDAWKKYSLEK